MENLVNKFFHIVDGNNYGASYPLLPDCDPLSSLFSEI